jgi:carotenoid 1,2-hydratase
MDRSKSRFRVGPSAMAVGPDGLTITIDEVSAPIPRRVRGQVRLTPGASPERIYTLDAKGRHHWRPIAPLGRVEADFDRPGMRFTGHGYLDSNWGSEPLEAGFRFWTWSRGVIGSRAAILYDCERRDGSTSQLALMIDEAGAIASFEPPPPCPLPGTFWRVARPTRSDKAAPAQLLRTLEDTPFYTRSVIAASIAGAPVTALHESLSLDRFSTPIVHWMLPFRMPRWG